MNFNKDMYGLGAAPSVIREIANYGWQRAAEVGAENVYNFSIGDPSVPAPDAERPARRPLRHRRPGRGRRKNRTQFPGKRPDLGRLCGLRRHGGIGLS